MTRLYLPGMTLDVRGERWTLSRAQRFESCTLLTLGGGEAANATRVLRVIDPFDRPRAVTSPRLRRRSRRHVLQSALYAIASARPADGMWAGAGAAIDIWPYQLEPALAVLSGSTRLLLADAVGLGKTIQAGLILSELTARGWIESALIVCPAGLRDTWARELLDRFRLRAVIVDPGALAERAAAVPPGVNPWAGEPLVITSIDFLKRPEVLAAVDRVPIDLLIADEAHHLAPGTDRGAAIARLAARAPWVVLMSATPHSGDAAAFTYLTSLGAHHDSLAVFRRSRQDVGFAATRRTRLLGVQPTDRERALFDEVAQYAQAIWRGRGAADHAARLVAITIARRAASSAAAIKRTLSRRLELLTGAPLVPAQAALPWDETDGADDVESDAALAVLGLQDVESERIRLEHLLSLIDAAAAGSKMRRLIRLLTTIAEPAVVFTEYRDTLDAIVNVLPESRRAGSVHGGMPPGLRRDVVDAFNAGRLDVLVATDAAGEGLNLQHRCRLVIDVELPWNPLRLEQRAGRVDRIGQQRPVHVIRLFHPGTIEARVRDCLDLRCRRAKETLQQCVSELDLGHAIFEDRDLPPMRSPSISGATTEHAWSEAARMSRLRQLIPGSEPCWCLTRRHRSLLLLHRLTVVNDDGRVMADRMLSHRLSLFNRPRSPRQWRDAIDAASERIQRMAAGDEGWSMPRRHALARRLESVRVVVAQQGDVAYQRSLFDRRAEVLAGERAVTASSLDAALARVASATAFPTQPRTRIELVAAWPEPRR